MSELYELSDEQRRKAETIVRNRIRLTSAYPELLNAALRFIVSLHHGGKNSDYYARDEREYTCEPERLLSVHSHVMNAKSARCKTLQDLANQVIRQAELPMNPPGRFRGENYQIHWGKVLEKWPEL